MFRRFILLLGGGCAVMVFFAHQTAMNIYKSTIQRLVIVADSIQVYQSSRQRFVSDDDLRVDEL